MSRLAAIAGGPPSRLGVTARSRRSRQSPPASIAPISSSIASTARKPHGSRAASPAAGIPIRSRRASACMRRRCASQSCAACGSSGIAGRSASASSGRCASPLARSIWRRAAVRSGSTTPRNPAARTSRKPAPKAKQRRGVGEARQQWQQVEQGEDEEGAENRERRPAGGPDPFPQQRGASEAQPCRKRSGKLDGGIFRAGGHAAPRFPAGSGTPSSSRAPSQSGIVSSDSNSR